MFSGIIQGTAEVVGITGGERFRTHRVRLSAGQLAASAKNTP